MEESRTAVAARTWRKYEQRQMLYLVVSFGIAGVSCPGNAGSNSNGLIS